MTTDKIDKAAREMVARQLAPQVLEVVRDIEDRIQADIQWHPAVESPEGIAIRGRSLIDGREYSIRVIGQLAVRGGMLFFDADHGAATSQLIPIGLDDSDVGYGPVENHYVLNVASRIFQIKSLAN